MIMYMYMYTICVGLCNLSRSDCNSCEIDNSHGFDNRKLRGSFEGRLSVTHYSAVYLSSTHTDTHTHSELMCIHFLSILHPQKCPDSDIHVFHSTLYSAYCPSTDSIGVNGFP